MFTKKDLARVQSLTEKLVQKVTFNGLSVADINYLKADFTWLEELQGRIVQDLKQQEENIRKAALQEQAKQALMDAEVQAAIPSNEDGEINEGFGEEPKPTKRKTKKKATKKKVANKS